MLFQIASAISDEARVKHATTGKGLTYWSPVVNMARDPRWGRQAENFGEDTYLASRLAVNFVKGMQGADPRYLKTVATLKHFACNSQESVRDTTSANVDPRSLREYYLPTFRAAVSEAKAFSVMTAYNSVDAIPAPANRHLLVDILRGEWGFQGYVVSDCDAIYDIWATHYYAATATQATALGIKNGTDLNCGGTYGDQAAAAVTSGLILESDLDAALKRIFKARFLLGEFDPPSMVGYNSIPSSAIDSDANKALAIRAAREAIVLLKNQGSLLPLNRATLGRVAVIGPNANVVRLGDYSGTPTILTSPLAGIETVLQTKIHAESYNSQSGIRTQNCNEGGTNIGWIEDGDYAEYDGVDFSSTPSYFEARVASATDGGAIELHLDTPDGDLIGTCLVPGTGDWQSWTTVSCDVAAASGVRNLYLKFVGGSGYLFNLTWFRFGPPVREVTYAEGTTISGSPNGDSMREATDLAASSNVAIVVCGTDQSDAHEGFDRSSLDLPGAQRQLIQAVYQANPRTILVLVNGSSSAITWEQANLPAILQAFFDGQSQGRAIADVLFGNYNPGGKLSTTWYRAASDQPDMSDYDIKNNRTYMYFGGTPLYPFGHGLSYTTFSYGNLQLSATRMNPNGAVTVSVDVTNTGSRDGDEVVQLYVRDSLSTLKMPVKQLKGFQRVSLSPGQTRPISFDLSYADLTYWDAVTQSFVVENGAFDVMVGSSSADIRASAQVVAAGGFYGAYGQIEAEYFDTKSGLVAVAACGEGGQILGSIKNGDSVAYNNVDFGNGATSFDARIAADASGGGTIELHLDGANGKLIGSLKVSATAGWQSYTTQSCTVSGVSGRHDLYLVFRAAPGKTNVCNLNWFRFRLAGAFDPDAYYKLINRTSGKALDNGGTGDNQAIVWQWDDAATSNTNQQWQIVALGSGTFKLVNHTSAKCLDNGGSTADGGAVWQQDDDGFTNPNQQWQIVDLRNGFYKLVSRSSRKCLEDSNGSTANGNPIWQWKDQAATNTNQQWKILKVR